MNILIENNIYWIFLISVGVLSGFGSGLLGIGSGLIAVPALIFALPHLGVSGGEIPKIAMASSLALMIPISIASTQSHAAKGAVDWKKLLLLAPMIAFGAYLSALLFPILNTKLLVATFVLVALFLAWRNLIPYGTWSADSVRPDGHLRPIEATWKGIGGGCLASSLGIGGAFFIVPMLSPSISMQRAIGTASALALPLSISGSFGYALADIPYGCSQGCVGYIFFPAVAAVGISAVLTVPLGTWLAHRSPVALLKRLFAVFLVVAAGSLSYNTFHVAKEMSAPRAVERKVEHRKPRTTPAPMDQSVLIGSATPSPKAAFAEPIQPADLGALGLPAPAVPDLPPPAITMPSIPNAPLPDLTWRPPRQ